MDPDIYLDIYVEVGLGIREAFKKREGVRGDPF